MVGENAPASLYVNITWSEEQSPTLSKLGRGVSIFLPIREMVVVYVVEVSQEWLIFTFEVHTPEGRENDCKGGRDGRDMESRNRKGRDGKNGSGGLVVHLTRGVTCPPNSTFVFQRRQCCETRC